MIHEKQEKCPLRVFLIGIERTLINGVPSSARLQCKRKLALLPSRLLLPKVKTIPEILLSTGY